MRLPKGTGVWTERLSALRAEPEALADKAAWAGLGHVACKSADSGTERDHDLRAELYRHLRDRDIEGWDWPYPGYRSTSLSGWGEGHWHAQFALSVGATGIIADIETDDASVLYMHNGKRAAAYRQGVEDTAPGLGYGLTSYRTMGGHGMPWAELTRDGFNAVQMYWTIAKMDPANCLAAALRSFASLPAPIYPLGGDAENAPLTGQAIRDFAAACDGHGLTSWGAYHWGGTIDWKTLRAVIAAPTFPPIQVVGPSGVIDCRPVVADDLMWVELGAILPVLLDVDLRFAGGAEDSPSRTPLRALAESCGWLVDARTAWPEVRLTRAARA